ncbi:MULTISPECIES: RagB/SusD family nutrient uptake outer membrane protein [unclassified Flavobacterium]|uniref:RagB/SusD family nutrient uptake outer membrane protein n=1 Tax=unclassified Flavobacterium TaxID=196869 RepID=UPI003F9235F3
MKKNNIIKTILFSSTVLLGMSCTNLDEEILDGYNADSGSGGTVNSTALLQSAIEGLRRFQEQGEMFTMDEMSTDALVGPTRGGDWDDNAKWRQFHVHTWGPDNTEIVVAWNDLLSNVYSCNQVIENSTDASQVRQARFLRAFYYYNVIDLFGQVPYREAGSSLDSDAKVWTRAEASTFVISELEAIVSTLPARTAGDPSIINKDAANFLLAKMYLNKGVFNASDVAGPYTFDVADMNKVVTYVNAISSTLAPDYWDNFTPTNNTSPELLFTSKNILGTGGGIQSRWRMGMHYNQTPGGWNGFATVAEYYNRFDASDKRRNKTSPSIIANFGNPIGFQIGQMYAPGGVTPLKDRNGNPLVFTPALTLVISDATAIETAGIRTQKYEPDPANLDNPDNDYVLMRYSDALLMKAEAIKRGATGNADAIMTVIATRAGIPAVPATLESIYAERGRELWFEGWRRNDMIRFGKFLEARELKPGVSDPKYLIFPIPADALFNKNIKQNPGY